MQDLTEAELALIEKEGGRRVRHHQVRQLVAEVRRRRIADGYSSSWWRSDKGKIVELVIKRAAS